MGSVSMAGSIPRCGMQTAALGTPGQGDPWRAGRSALSPLGDRKAGRSGHALLSWQGNVSAWRRKITQLAKGCESSLSARSSPPVPLSRRAAKIISSLPRTGAAPYLPSSTTITTLSIGLAIIP